MALQTEIHELNREKGFWDNKNVPGARNEKVMLIIAELAEAVEADRKGRRARVEHFVSNITHSRIINLDPTYDGNITPESAWHAHFTTLIKDTVEDEIADATIRLLDFCRGYDIELNQEKYAFVSEKNFAADVLYLVNATIQASRDNLFFDFSCLLAGIIKFCGWYDIDLLQHVQWKFRYNKTRPHMHGKKY